METGVNMEVCNKCVCRLMALTVCVYQLQLYLFLFVFERLFIGFDKKQTEQCQ